MSKKYDSVMEMICDAARFKMECNAHKGNIEDMSAARAVELATEELKEMLEAVSADDYEGVVLEAADVLNFIIGVAYNAMNEYKRRK
jgi:phosphoribosyl-ATP pyrophosphohydrolase